MESVIIGFITGFILGIIALILFGTWMDLTYSKHPQRVISEDFEFMAIPKSKIEKVREFLDKENNDNDERTKTHI